LVYYQVIDVIGEGEVREVGADSTLFLTNGD